MLNSGYETEQAEPGANLPFLYTQDNFTIPYALFNQKESSENYNDMTWSLPANQENLVIDKSYYRKTEQSIYI